MLRPDRLPRPVLVRPQDGLHEVVAEEPGPSGHEQPLSCQVPQLVGQVADDDAEIFRDDLGGGHHRHASTSFRQWNASAYPLGALHSTPRRRMSARKVSFVNQCLSRWLANVSQIASTFRWTCGVSRRT